MSDFIPFHCDCRADLNQLVYLKSEVDTALATERAQHQQEIENLKTEPEKERNNHRHELKELREELDNLIK